MTRKITIYVPLNPKSEPAPVADSGSGVTFGPIGWEFASQGDDGDSPAAFTPPLEALHMRAFDFAVATCPGAVSWRLDPEPDTPADYDLYVLVNGAAVIQAKIAPASASLYATGASGEELGPITVGTVS